MVIWSKGRRGGEKQRERTYEVFLVVDGHDDDFVLPGQDNLGQPTGL